MFVETEPWHIILAFWLESVKACSFQNNCEINKQTRSFCLACRLKKCLAVGMNPGLIFNTEKREELKRKVNENRRKQQEQRSSGPVDGVTESPSSDNSASRSADVTPGWNFQDINKPDYSITTIESTGEHNQLDAVRCPKIADCSGHHSDHGFAVQGGASICSKIPSSSTGKLTNSPLGSVSDYAVLPSVSSETISTKLSTFQHPFHEQLPSDPSMYWHLSQEDRCLLAHLSSLYEETVLSVVKEAAMGKSVRIQEMTHSGYLGDIDDCLVNIVKFAKKVEDFSRLSTDDQIALLKSTTTSTSGIRTAALYVAEKNGWVTKFGLATSQQLRALFPNFPSHLGKKALDISFTLKHIVKNDNIIWSLLHCIMLFDPNNERIMKRQLVNSFRDKYLLLLKHYLESVYSYMYSDHYLTALLEQLQEQRALSLLEITCMKSIIPIPTPLIAEMIDHWMD